jgi:hypothetical protein
MICICGEEEAAAAVRAAGAQITRKVRRTFVLHEIISFRGGTAAVFGSSSSLFSLPALALL